MRPSLHHRRGAWTYAIVGGLVAAPLVVVHNRTAGLGGELSLLPGLGTGLPLTAVFVGGLVAGVLAGRTSADADTAAAGAGLFGSVPALGWALAYPAELALETGGAWWFDLVEVVLLVVFAGLVLTLGAVGGLLGGLVGRWLASQVG
ncbi:DUF5518 domain-containing protein [Haloarchaeobius iranensis]|uniref:Uncharacterized protein n=1 Tax=Haloarchaeobius iranensis TaxID=996166 RepID=A0A1G9ZHT1_9EURY|nr:DUF5518 domain-containing protein [Haloarchaeobius iranensis]SDN20607.1 hypothetical protein SAMN05192554_12047 [Haloarchaeobius iranensis]